MKISFGDIEINNLARQYINEVFQKNWITEGEKVKELEEKFAKLFNYKHAIMVSSGTDANINAFLSLYDFGAQFGDEVIVPALSFIATSTAVIAAGLKPVFVDIKRETLNINEELVEQAITPKTRAICAVSTMGKPCQVDVLKDIAKKHKLMFIVDNAEGHGCSYKHKYMGFWSDVVTYSAYAAHLLVCGESGFCCSKRESIDEIIRSTKTHGRRHGKTVFDHVRLGYNSKTTDLHACIGLSQIPSFKINFRHRQQNVKQMRKGLTNCEEFVYFSEEDKGFVNSPHAFSIVLKDKKYDIEKFKRHLTKHNIEWKLNFKCIPTQQLAFKSFGHQLGDFPESEFVGDLGVHWGCHAGLNEEHCNYVIGVVGQYFNKKMWEK